MPPLFHDWKPWIKFRAWVNRKLKIKAIVKSLPFAIVSSVFISLTFVNCCLALYTKYRVFDIIDDVFMVLYCLEISAKLVGVGPENFFNDTWNKLDFFLITIGLVLELAPNSVTPHNSEILFKMTRIFRVTMIVGIVQRERKVKMRSEVYLKSKKLISQMAIIIPIVLKFFPIYLISYYALGVLGMQIFNRDNQSLEGN